MVQNSIVAATQNAAGNRRRPSAVACRAGVAIARRRLNHHASAGTASEARTAARQPAPAAAASESAPISTTYATLAATLASVSATARRSP